MNIYFTSDTHFFHKNVIKYSNRPFESIEEMNETIISNWNKVVKKQDTVWHLGDFSFHKDINESLKILKSLNGQIHFIIGNHDRTIRKIFDRFQSVQYYHELNMNKQKFVLCHYALLTWNKGHYGSIMLHGHSHGSLNHMNENTRRLDVGVDNFNFTPISVDEIIKIMNKKEYAPVDHHQKR